MDEKRGRGSKSSTVTVERRSMDRYLSQIDVWAVALGCMVGWGAFVMPGTTFLPIAGPAGTVLALAICTALILVIGRNYAYLMARRPAKGGIYSSKSLHHRV